MPSLPIEKPPPVKFPSLPLYPAAPENPVFSGPPPHTSRRPPLPACPRKSFGSAAPLRSVVDNPAHTLPPPGLTPPEVRAELPPLSRGRPISSQSPESARVFLSRFRGSAVCVRRSTANSPGYRPDSRLSADNSAARV